MLRFLRSCVLTALLLATSAALANFHLFQIEQIYSNADGTVQFVVMHESGNANGEHLWAGQALTSSDGISPTQVFPFQSNLPSSNTAGKRVLIATQGFAALGLVTPNYIMPTGFLPLANGTVNFAGGIDTVMYSSLPTNGTQAINRSGMPIQNVATNFAGVSASVVGTPAVVVPQIGHWWNPAEDGTGYNLDIRNGRLVMSMFTYEAVTGHSEWYVSVGDLTDNGTKFTGTLDKYRGGQCLACPYTGRPTFVGNDGNISITFTSPRSAIVNLPNNRVSPIQPLF